MFCVFTFVFIGVRFVNYLQLHIRSNRNTYVFILKWNQIFMCKRIQVNGGSSRCGLKMYEMVKVGFWIRSNGALKKCWNHRKRPKLANWEKMDENERGRCGLAEEAQITEIGWEWVSTWWSRGVKMGNLWSPTFTCVCPLSSLLFTILPQKTPFPLHELYFSFTKQTRNRIAT